MTKKLKSDLNELIEALCEGKYIRPKNSTMRVCTSVPILRVDYLDSEKDGKYRSNYLDINEYYFKQGFEIPDLNDIKSIRVVGEASYKVYEIDYIYFNPQCNRTLAKCKCGYITDYPMNLARFIYDEFEILTKEKVSSEPVKITMEEVIAKFGYPVEIID